MNEPTIHCAEDGHVLEVTIARHEKKNALTQEMYQQLTAALASARSAEEIRAVLLRGHPTVFCAGNDILDFLDDPPRSLDSPVGHFLTELASFPKPLVAAIRGAALGVGTTMLLHFDLAYANEQATFQLPFTQLGLCPEAAASVLVPLQVGRARAAEILLLGERFDAQQACAMGLINEVLDDPRVEDRARARAQAIARLPPAAVRATKGLLLEGRRAWVETAMQRESALFFERLRSPEAKEAFSAFVEKRKPDFSRFK